MCVLVTNYSLRLIDWLCTIRFHDFMRSQPRKICVLSSNHIQSSTGCNNHWQHLLVCLSGCKRVNSGILITIPTRCCSNSAMTTDTTGACIPHILPSKVMVRGCSTNTPPSSYSPPTNTCVHMNCCGEFTHACNSSLPTTHEGNQWTLSQLLPSWNVRLL